MIPARYKAVINLLIAKIISDEISIFNLIYTFLPPCVYRRPTLLYTD